MIRPCSLAEIASWLGADTVSGPDVGGVSTDTRQLRPGDLFVALRGERFDGHRFLATAKAAGAVAAVVDTLDDAVDLPQLIVPDTLAALARLGQENRRGCQATCVAVTGSSGKTTVKEMLASILGGVASTLATAGNLNNHIGVPLTLLRLAPEHRYAVIEHGASGVGEIAQTIQLTRPRVGIITNAGESHLEGFGSYDNIVVAKGELIDGVVDDGVVVLNRDDAAFSRWQRRAGDRRVLSVSLADDAAAAFVARDLTSGPEGQRFRIQGPDGWQATIELALAGEHNVMNALLAAAACYALGLAPEQVEQGLAAMVPVRGRLSPTRLNAALTLIDDSYNANPSSTKAALKVLAGYDGVRIAVLGTMAELGPDSRRLHRDVGAFARELGIEQLLAVGPGCEGYGDGFGQSTQVFDSHDKAVEYLLGQGGQPVTVLLKGSRSSAMERVAEGLKNKVTDSCCSG
ncbi:UDP-N-acetylmuramoyl-tripeptide--D-alanyl-D-alanine ligase [Marinobacter xestospongiae]|uniref:UDP-N-acetylmuramoyl-tripeptide--D-alanyl-D- alanine ligase n=1 Tax=Marinobacter xestospongiae TaxID=994319 RepID=UPI002003B788|nr:UDP-N-acetylmuramoyl-tripeptide--D-alanyl-D-alanine ligase [Marinobacter xestospongiae]